MRKMVREDLGEKNHRKIHGVFYTPTFVSNYILEKTILYYLSKDLQNPAQSIQQLLKEYNKDSSNIPILIDRLKNIRLLDPSCGDGVFLIGAYNILSEIWLQISQLNNNDIDFENIAKDIVINNLFGVDILYDTILNLKKKLLPLIKNSNPDVTLLDSNFKVGDALNNDNFNWIKEFPKIFTEGGFNIVVGNPPWGAILKPPYNYYKENYETFSEPPESFGLFIELVVSKLLRKEGYFSFIIPNEICFNQAFIKLRKYLMENTRILELTNLGEGIFNEVTRPSLIFILEKSIIEPKDFNEMKIQVNLNYKKASNRSNEYNNNSENKFSCYQRSYKSFYLNDGFRWDIHRTEEDSNFLAKVKNNPKILKLTDIVTNGRGFDFNKDGNYILCYNCGNGNTYYGKGNSSSGDSKKEKFCIYCNALLPRSSIKGMLEFDSSKKAVGEIKCAFKNMKETSEDRPVLVGEDIQRLFVQKPSRYINPNDPELRFINFRLDKNQNNLQLYSGERILVRKVSKLLCLSIYDDDCLCNDQIYVWKKKSEYSKYSHFYLAALMISKFQYYYYILETGNIDKIAYPHFRQEDIKNFLIPKIDFLNDKEVQKHNLIVRLMKELINLVKNYYNNDKEFNKKEYYEIITEKEDDLNREICNLFEIEFDFIQKRLSFLF